MLNPGFWLPVLVPWLKCWPSHHSNLGWGICRPPFWGLLPSFHATGSGALGRFRLRCLTKRVSILFHLKLNHAVRPWTLEKFTPFLDIFLEFLTYIDVRCPTNVTNILIFENNSPIKRPSLLPLRIVGKKWIKKAWVKGPSLGPNWKVGSTQYP